MKIPRLLPAAAFAVLLGGGADLAAEPARPVELSTNVVVTGETLHVTENGRTLTFQGNVKAVHGPDVLTCEWLRSDKTEQLLHAKEKVVFTRIEGAIVWEAYGDEGTYHTETGEIRLWRHEGRAELYKRAPGTETPTLSELRGRRLHADASFTFAHAEGDVYGIDRSTATRQEIRFWAEEARFGEAGGSVELTGGRPLLILRQPAEVRTVQGRRIRYQLREGRLIAEGEAVSRILPDAPPRL